MYQIEEYLGDIQNNDDLYNWVVDQFRQINATFLLGKYPQITLETLHEEPERPQDKMIVEADGTDWDPGSGAGLYIYRTGTGWVFIV